jgi:glycosyltransferase involved in cell wall biosynthesis
MKKKVLIFIEDGTFTYDNRVIQETNALLNAGWAVTVISEKSNEDPYYRKVNENLHTYFFPKPTARGTLGHILEHSISIVLGSLLSFWIYLRHGFSIFHACNPMDILWIIALPYKILGVKFIYDQHDLCPELYLSRGGSKKGLLYKILIYLEKCSYNIADVVISTNESFKKIALKRGGVKPQQVFVVRNGPNLEQFKPTKPKIGLKRNGNILVGYLGNMNPQDGVDCLLEAAHEIVINRQYHKIAFILIGGGSVQMNLKQQSAELGLKDYVKFTGRLKPDDQMMSILSACDICVQPDLINPLNDKTTMCKAMEYMALNKPVVAFDLLETRVSCGDAATYVYENSSVALADKIMELVDDPEKRLEMGSKGRSRIKSKFSWSHSIPNLLNAYELILKKCDFLVSSD